MLRGADSRVGRGVKNKPHLLNDLAKAKGRRSSLRMRKTPLR
jgi:hypothetical protein